MNNKPSSNYGGISKMKEHMYQLSVELQVHSTNPAAKDVEHNWHQAVSDWVKYSNLPATVSAVKCARVHEFDEAPFDSPQWAVDKIAALVKDEADGGFAEFDAPSNELVWWRWPNVTDWECGAVTYSEGVVTLHDLYVVE